MQITDSYKQVLLDTIASDVIGHGGVEWTVFSFGPLRAAYPNFPIGLTEKNISVLRDFTSTTTVLKSRGVDLARISAPSSLRIPERSGVINLPETRIADLSGWDTGALSAQTRRKIRKCHASGLSISHVTATDATPLHNLYLATIRRHNAKERYPRHYFERLCEASNNSEDVVVAKALIREEIAGFIALKLDEKCVYYLHGAYDDKFSRARPGFFSMEWAIQYSKKRRKTQFNFLTSPTDQPALRQYKESFGAESRMRAHWNESFTPLGYVASEFLKFKRRLKRA